MKTSTCKIGIVENYALFSSGLKADLEAMDGNQVIASGKNADDLTKQLNGTEPDIILIDVLNYNNAGIGVVKSAMKIFPGVPLLLIIAV